MEKLLAKSQLKILNVPQKYRRYLYDEIQFRDRLIGLRGARGTGKTTLLLQIGAERKADEVLYLALDDIFFMENSLYGIAEQFSLMGGKLLLLDEVHKYPNWSRELKLIYDDLKDLQVIFTSSSILDIYKGESDLSRRAISYTLKELSFREFLSFYYDITLTPITLSDILNNHSEISKSYLKHFKPFKYLPTYIKAGSYPYFEKDVDAYYQKLMNTVNLILDIDLQSIQGIDYYNIAKFKKLLYVIATNVPFTPNISKLSEKIGLNRNALTQALYLLEKSELIHTLVSKNRSVSVLSKPDKIWLHNTNLCHAIADVIPNQGTLRETFLIQHLSVKHSLSLPKTGDLIVDKKYVLEIGGKKKNLRQIKEVKNSYLVKDDLEIGVLNSIPLWLFGFIY